MLYSHLALLWAAIQFSSVAATALDPRTALPTQFLNTSSITSSTVSQNAQSSSISEAPSSAPKDPPTSEVLPPVSVTATASTEGIGPGVTNIITTPSTPTDPTTLSTSMISGTSASQNTSISSTANSTTSHHTKSSKTKSSTSKESRSHTHTRTLCTTLLAGAVATIYSAVPNTTTITITGNSSTYSPVPEFTPPVDCGVTTSTSDQGPAAPGPTESWWGSNSPVPTTTFSYLNYPVGHSTTTVIITSKNPPIIYTTAPTGVEFPGLPPEGKVSVSQPTPDSVQSGDGFGFPQATSSGSSGGSTDSGGGSSGSSGGSESNGGSSGSGSSGSGSSDSQGGGNPAPAPTTVTAGGVPIVLSPTNVVIGGQTVGSTGGSTVVNVNGQPFTVNPSQVIAPGTIIAIPSPGGIFREAPTPTVIAGVSVGLAPGVAVIDGTTFEIGSGAPQETIVANGQTISIGPAGLGFASTTVLPPAGAEPTNVVIVGAQPISAIGTNEAVIGDATFTYGTGIPVQTDVFNGETITIAPQGIELPQTVLGGESNAGLEIGIAGGLSVTEIGSTIAVVSGTTFIVGPGATPTTAVVSGHTITANPSGLDLGSTILAYPFNPMTSTVTAGGITFSEIGTSLVVIGGSTFTIGPGATPTTDVYDGQTISIGPGGVGFKTTTVVPPTASATSTKKKNGVEGLRPVFGILGACIAISIGYLI